MSQRWNSKIDGICSDAITMGTDGTFVNGTQHDIVNLDGTQACDTRERFYDLNCEPVH